MAEVLVPTELPLDGMLKAIVCRTEYDRRTLLHMLGGAGAEMRQVVTVEQLPNSTFVGLELFLTRITPVGSALILTIKQPNKTPARGFFEISVSQLDANGITMAEKRWNQPPTIAPLRVEGFVPSQSSIWKVEVDDCLAFHAPLDATPMTMR